MRKGLVRLQAIFLVDPCRPINTIDDVKQTADASVCLFTGLF